MGTADANFKGQLKRYLGERRQADWKRGNSGKRLRTIKPVLERWRHAGVGSKRLSRRITQLRLGWNPLEATRARQQQSDGQCTYCDGGREDREHYLLQCPKWKSQRALLAEALRNTGISLPRVPSEAAKLLLGGAKLRQSKQAAVQYALGDFIAGTRRFEESMSTGSDQK